MTIHEDDRRTLIDWNDNLPIETCKIVIAKKDGNLGNHFHKEKTERFMLIKGSAQMFVHPNNYKTKDMELFKPYIIKPEQRHMFSIKKNSVLLCLVDKQYDPKDDYEV